MSSTDEVPLVSHTGPPQLPLELWENLISYLNPDSAQAAILSQVCKHFADIAEPYVWRELAIHTPHQWAEHTRSSWLSKPEAGRCLKDKLEGMTRAADERRWGMVKGAIIVPTPGAVEPIIEVLEKVSATLQSLTIAQSDHSFPHDSEYPDWLDLQILASGNAFSFPSLTSVRIQAASLHYAQFLIILCEASPHLAFLDVEVFDSDETPTSSDITPAALARFSRETGLRRLHLHYDVDLCDEYAASENLSIMVDLVSHSPQLELLSLSYDVACTMDMWGLDMIVSRLAGLTELACPIDLLRLFAWAHMAPIYPPLQRLVLEMDGHLFPVSDAPGMPQILQNDNTNIIPCLCEAVLRYPPLPLDHHVGRLERCAIARCATLPVVTERVSDLAGWARRCPSLRTIHFMCDSAPPDTLDPSGPNPRHILPIVFDRLAGDNSASGDIQSITHGGPELVMSTLPFRFQQVTEPYGPESQLVLSVAGDGQSLLGQETVWLRFVDLGGKTVPTAVWDTSRMRKVEGANEADWAGRRVEVSARAWKVLTDWEAGTLA